MATIVVSFIARDGMSPHDRLGSRGDDEPRTGEAQRRTGSAWNFGAEGNARSGREGVKTSSTLAEGPVGGLDVERRSAGKILRKACCYNRPRSLQDEWSYRGLYVLRKKSTKNAGLRRSSWPVTQHREKATWKNN